MKNGLKVTVTPVEFSERKTGEKLDLIFQAVTNQQKICANRLSKYDQQFADYDHMIDNMNTEFAEIKCLVKNTNPIRSKTKDMGIVGASGVGGVGLWESIKSLIDYFK